MRGLARTLLLAATCCTLWGCTAPQSPEVVARNAVAREDLDKAGLQVYWTRTLTLPDGQTIARMYRLDENIYCLTEKNRLYVINAANGIPKWDYSEFNVNTTVFAPSHANAAVLPEEIVGVKNMNTARGASASTSTIDVVAFNTLTEGFIFDRKTGKLFRRFKFDFSASTSAATDGDYYYIGATNGWYYVYRLSDAVKLWWGQTEGAITAPVVVFNSRLYVASTDGGLDVMLTGDHARKAWSSDDKYSLKMRGPITGRFHVDDRGCFVGCEDQCIYGFELATGKPLWDRVYCSGPLSSPVQVSRNSLFQYASGDKFYAVNLSTGKIRWTLPQARSAAAVIKGTAYLTDSYRNLLLVDEVLGEVKATIPMPGLDMVAGNTTSSCIYGASKNGLLVCIRLKTAGHLTAEMLKATQKMDKD